MAIFNSYVSFPEGNLVLSNVWEQFGAMGLYLPEKVARRGSVSQEFPSHLLLVKMRF